MKALIKNVPGILRVESPPFRTAEYVVNESGNRVVRIRIRFAFDAVRAVNEGRPTVTLTMKSNPSRNYQKPASPKSMNLKEAARSLGELVKSINSNDQLNAEVNATASINTTTTKQFKFDLLSAIPDTSLSSFRQGLPAQYDYLISTNSQLAVQQATASNSAITDKDYLLSLIANGVDPASISENFLLPDPVTGKVDAHASSRFNFYTSVIPPLSNTEKQYLLTNFVIFEQDIELTQEEFSLLTSYEFEYLGIAEESAVMSITSVPVKSSDLLTQMNSYSDSPTQSSQKFERRLDSYFAISSEPFRLASSTIRAAGASVPLVTRTQRTLIGGGTSPRFRSIVTGKITSSNGNGPKTARQEPDVFPFYVESRGNEKIVQIVKLPPGSVRIEVFAKDVTQGSRKYEKVASSQVSSQQKQSIAITLSSVDKIYELKLSAYDSRGRETTSSNTVTINNKQPYPGAHLNVTIPRRVTSDTSSVSIAAAFTDSGRQDLTNLITQLKSAGVSESVISDISNESSLYSQIFSYRVETIELSTGKQTFSKELAPSAGSPTAEYEVTSTDPLGTVLNVSLGMKSPDALVPTQTNFRFGLFGGSYRKSQPSLASLSKNKKSGESFDYIDTGIKTTIFIPPRSVEGNVVSLTATKTLRASTLLKWSYSGDLTQVDHFQVLGASGDAECLLGCSFKSLSFEDSVLSNRAGITRYTVRPVFLDLSVGSPTVVYQNVVTTLPDLLLPNFKSGSVWSLKDGFTESERSFRVSQAQARQGTFTSSLQSQSISSTVLVSLEAQEAIGEASLPISSLNSTSSIKKSFAAAARSSSKTTINSSQISKNNRSIARVRK